MFCGRPRFCSPPMVIISIISSAEDSMGVRDMPIMNDEIQTALKNTFIYIAFPLKEYKFVLNKVFEDLLIVI